MHPIYQTIEGVLQDKITEGWKAFNQSEEYQFYNSLHRFLWNNDEYTNIHRRRLPHAPYEYAARFLSIPFMNLLTHLGIHMNTWFPGYYDIRDEYPHETTQATPHPGGRISHLILLTNNGIETEKFCKISLEFMLLHEDIDNAFGFKEPKLKIVEAYQEDPGKCINIDLLKKNTPKYHTMGDSRALSKEEVYQTRSCSASSQ